MLFFCSIYIVANFGNFSIQNARIDVFSHEMHDFDTEFLVCKEAGTENLMLETSYETEVPALHKMFKELPVDKFLYGSNYPNNFTNLSIMKFNSLNLSVAAMDKIFYQNAAQLLKLK